MIPAMLSLARQLLTVALGGVMIWGEWHCLVVGFSPILVLLGVVDKGLGQPTPAGKTSGAENQRILVTKVSFIR